MVRTWGSTPQERAELFQCDSLLPNSDDALFRAIDVRADAPVVFRWLCQLRAAPYSYDWIDNRGRKSPPQLTSGLEDLAVGQRVMSIFTLESFTQDEHITLRCKSRFFGDIACTYRVRATGAGTSRLVVKLLTRYPRGITGAIGRKLLPTGDLIMMRKQLRTLAHLAES